jgi:hypothetical protein
VKSKTCTGSNNDTAEMVSIASDVSIGMKRQVGDENMWIGRGWHRMGYLDVPVDKSIVVERVEGDEQFGDNLTKRWGVELVRVCARGGHAKCACEGVARHGGQKVFERRVTDALPHDVFFGAPLEVAHEARPARMGHAQVWEGAGDGALVAQQAAGEGTSRGAGALEDDGGAAGA